MLIQKKIFNRVSSVIFNELFLYLAGIIFSKGGFTFNVKQWICLCKT